MASLENASQPGQGASLDAAADEAVPRRIPRNSVSGISPRRDSRPKLSSDLEDLCHTGLLEQADWWKRTARGLGPWAYSDPRTDYDAVSRFFDGTSRGIRYMFGREYQKRLAPDAELVCSLLLNHLRFYGGAAREACLEDEHFRALCGLLLDPDGDVEAVRDSFERAVRQLRIGYLLSEPRRKGQGRWTLYCYDYNDAEIAGSYVPSVSSRRRFLNGHWVNEPEVAQQRPCGAPGSDYASVDEFLFSEPLCLPESVRWVHTHRPCQELLLALGQQYHLRVHAQCLLARLQGAQPQAELSENSDDWSSIVYPAVYMDKVSKASFENYQVWYHERAAEAEKSGYMGTKFDHSKYRSTMPGMSLGVVQVNLMIFWSRSEDSTVISVAAEPKYLAHWATPDVQHQESWFCNFCTSLAGTLGASCCRRRKDDYQEVSGDESVVQTPRDLECAQEEETLEEEENLFERRFKEFELMAEAEGSTHFEDTFAPVLRQLGEQHSVLRMGSHVQLVYRLLLNRSVDYLDIIAMYTVSIAHLQELLNSKDYTKKHDIITKVSVAKLDLETLLRMVELFNDNVLPSIVAHEPTDDNVDDLPNRVIRHHKFDLENNVRQFLMECKTQIRLCDSLTSEYDRKSQDAVNRVLNFLTMITFLIMPLQILTGLYGMNFKHMPELDWKFGYYYFFCLAAGMTSTFCLILLVVLRMSQ